MTNGAEVTIRITGDSKNYRVELDKVERETKKTSKVIQKSAKGLTGQFNKQQKALSKTALEARKARQSIKRLADAERKNAAAIRKANAQRTKRVALLRKTALLTAAGRAALTVGNRAALQSFSNF